MRDDLDLFASMITGRSNDFRGLDVVAPVAPSGPSWSGPFRAVGSDGNDWFVKSLDTCPPGQGASIVIERVVAEAGRLIGAPVCTTSLIRIPPELAGWSPRPGVQLTPGLAHASRALEHADERGRPQLDARLQDDNANRHVGVYALYDWCFGYDQQWLYDIDNDRTIYSHDHGLYLPPAGVDTWDESELLARCDEPHVLPDPVGGLNAASIDAVATALESVDQDSIIEILNTVPESWPVSDVELGALGWFLWYRARPTAVRLRALI